MCLLLTCVIPMIRGGIRDSDKTPLATGSRILYSTCSLMYQQSKQFTAIFVSLIQEGAAV